MTTYADMRERIADELANDGDITSAQINNAIKTAIQMHERRSFWFNMGDNTFSTVSGREFYTSSNVGNLGNIIEFLSIRCQYGDTVSPLGLIATSSLQYVQNSVIEALQNGTKTGTPRFYSRYDQQLRLFPIPDASYTMPIRYVYKLDVLAADDDSNAWTEEAEELIREAAKRIIAIDILNAPDLAANFAALEDVALQKLVAEFAQRFPFAPVAVPQTMKTEG